MNQHKSGKNMVHKVLTVVGARPQFIKAAAVSRAFKGHPGLRETMVHTGQHFDKKCLTYFSRIGDTSTFV